MKGEEEMPELDGLLETALFVDDLDRARRFYEEVLGLEVFQSSDRGCGLRVPGGQLLLLVRRGATDEPHVTPGGTIPPCGTEGSSHLAFAVSEAALPEWRRHLESQGVESLGEVTFERGGRSLYFRDPDGHLLELATPGIWEVY